MTTLETKPEKDILPKSGRQKMLLIAGVGLSLGALVWKSRKHINSWIHKPKPRYSSPQIHTPQQEVHGNADIMYIFYAGNAFQFPFHKDVHYLFLGGEIPADPITRALITEQYANALAFASREDRLRIAKRTRHLHKPLERKYGAIDEASYRDVLLMSMYYNERAYEMVHGPLTAEQRQTMFAAGIEFGNDMGIPDLPETHEEFIRLFQERLAEAYKPTPSSWELLKCYRRCLGSIRYFMLQRLAAMLVPEEVREMSGIKAGWLVPLLVRTFIRIRCKPISRLALCLFTPRRYWKLMGTIKPYTSKEVSRKISTLHTPGRG